MADYDLETKIKVLDEVKGRRDADVAEEYGMSRRTIINWKKQEDKLRKKWDRKRLKEESQVLNGEIAAVAEYEKKYLQKLEDLGELEDRKKRYVAGIEKIMWDHLGVLDEQRLDDMKPDVRVRMLKDLNEMREKLSGEPSVIMEYRNKFQMNVMMVVRDMMPDRAEEFLERIKIVEDEH